MWGGPGGGRGKTQQKSLRRDRQGGVLDCPDAEGQQGLQAETGPRPACHIPALPLKLRYAAAAKSRQSCPTL